MELKQIDVSKPLEAYDEVLATAWNQGREPNTADRMLAMRAAILAYEADKSSVTPPTRGTGSQLDAEPWVLEAVLATYLLREMPAGTVIGNPAWWAARIAAAIEAELPSRFRAQVGDTKDSNS